MDLAHYRICNENRHRYKKNVNEIIIYNELGKTITRLFTKNTAHCQNVNCSIMCETAQCLIIKNND